VLVEQPQKAAAKSVNFRYTAIKKSDEGKKLSVDLPPTLRVRMSNRWLGKLQHVSNLLNCPVLVRAMRWAPMFLDLQTYEETNADCFESTF